MSGVVEVVSVSAVELKLRHTGAVAFGTKQMQHVTCTKKVASVIIGHIGPNGRVAVHPRSVGVA